MIDLQTRSTCNMAVEWLSCPRQHLQWNAQFQCIATEGQPMTWSQQTTSANLGVRQHNTCNRWTVDTVQPIAPTCNCELIFASFEGGWVALRKVAEQGVACCFPWRSGFPQLSHKMQPVSGVHVHQLTCTTIIITLSIVQSHHSLFLWISQLFIAKMTQ